MLPFLIPAILGAVASAATGIAGAAGQSAATDAQNQQNASQRAMQERIAKMQIAEQQRQGRLSALQSTQQALGASYQDAGQVALQRAADRQRARQDIMGSLSNTFGG